MTMGEDTRGGATDGVGVGVSNSRIGIMGIEGTEDRVGMRLGCQKGEPFDKLFRFRS